MALRFLQISPLPVLCAIYLSRAVHSLYLDLHLAFRYVIYDGYIRRISRAQTYVFCRAPTWSKCRGFTRIARRESSWASCTRTRGLCTTVSVKAPRSLVSLNYSRLASCVLHVYITVCSVTYVHAVKFVSRFEWNRDLRLHGCTFSSRWLVSRVKKK